MDEPHVIINKNLSIPVRELLFRFSTSRGPGGQHVNKSETRVTLLFDVANAPSLDDKTRAALLKKLAHRLTKDGVLQIDVQEHRSQLKNRETAVSRFQSLLAKSLKPAKKRRPTKPSRAAKEKRLAEKKRRSQRKKDRSERWE